TVPASSPIFRWEGAPNVEVSPYTPDWGGLIPDPTLVRNHLYRVAFTCDCQQFEFVIQARQGNYRLWVDGAWTTPAEVPQVNNYPDVGFYRVQFPDKRARQIKVGLTDITPFYGVVTSASDTISPPQTPLGPKVVVFGDSWTGPTIIQPLLLPAQPGGSGYAQLLGEYFNWDWREDGLGSTGFVNPGTFGITFPQRALTDICGRDPDLVVVTGGVNDGGQTESAVEGAVTTFLSELQTCVPNTKVLLFGPQEPLPNVAGGMAAAAAKFGSNVSYYPSPQNWIYGQSNDTTTGNAYIYLNGHPTPLGHAYWAEQMIQTILGAFPAMTPQTFSLFDGAPAAGSFSYSVRDKSLLPVGQHTLSATFTPQDNVNYTTATQNAILTVAKASSSIVLSSSASSIAPGKTFTLQSTVSPQIGGIPTGAVTFMDNGNPIGNAVLSSTGSAAFNTAVLTTGTHLITASYPGDGNFLPSATTAPVSVLIANPDFSFTLGTTGLTVLPGQSSTTKVTVHPVAGLVAGLMLSCSGLPASASCSLQNTSQIAVNQQDIAATVVVQAYALKAQLDRGLPGLNPNLPGLGQSGLTG
ncbi:MAG TPA: Ig-like domain repeat protein, partial [Acidobacteriaceae bacterium]|nr:Ig-like domain repeat protein [Acidobacteriaceae bacterium]